MPRLAALLLLFVLNLSSARADRPARPNILWLIAEDCGVEWGCYGAKQVWTPNVDRLANEGVRYTRAFTTAPVCSASRSAFNTGMYQTTIGALHHRSHRDDGYQLPDGVRVLSDWMRDAGYFTANVVDLPSSFGFKGTGKTDWNFSHDGPPFDSRSWDDLKSHQPFYAQINFQETHRVGRQRESGLPWNSPKKADPNLVELPPYYPDHPTAREDWAAYLDAVSELDRKIGVILKQLADDGLADDTIVMVVGDHGHPHVRGKQFCYDEGLHVPMVLRWAKNFPTPQHYAPGTVDERLISSLDWSATALDIAGAAVPPKMQGQIFVGEHAAAPREYVFGARDRCDETTFRFRTVRDARYRYIRNFTPERPFLQANAYKEKQYPVWNLLKELDAAGKLTPVQKFLTAPTMPAEELYDTEADPHEIRNLVDSPDPAHQVILTRLRAALDKWIIDSDDQGRFPEPPEVAAAKGATKASTDPNGPASGKKKKNR